MLPAVISAPLFHSWTEQIFIYIPADQVPLLLASLWPTLGFQGCGSWGGLTPLVPYTAVSPPLLLPEALPRETSPTLALNHTLPFLF